MNVQVMAVSLHKGTPLTPPTDAGLPVLDAPYDPVGSRGHSIYLTYVQDHDMIMRR